MKTRAIIPLVVGLAVGTVAIKLFADVLQKARQERAASIVHVVCASVDIPPTAQIRESMIAVKPVPKSLVPKDVFLDPKEVIGRVARLTVPSGMPILASLLSPKGTPPGLATRIKEGYRAVAVQVDEFAGVAGWVKPGSLVDVVAVMNLSGGGIRNTISKTILEKVEVLAVGQEIVNEGDASASLARSVTLLVRPEDVPKLHLAATKGKIRLAMRNQKDFSLAETAATTDKDLLSVPSDTREKSRQVSTPVKKSFLASLLCNQRKSGSNATDKDFGGFPSSQPASVGRVPTIQDRRWRVEVLQGSEAEQIWFEDSTPGAKRLDPSGRNRTQDFWQGSAAMVPHASAARRSAECSMPSKMVSLVDSRESME